MSSRRVVLTSTFLMIAAGGMAACDSAEEVEDGHFYCSDANGVVIDEDYCDNSSPNYNSSTFIWWGGSSVHGNSSYPVGTKLPAGGQKFSVTDTAARQKFGLPSTGRVSNGTVKTGVVGKGGAGSSVKGGGGSVGGGGAKGGSGGG